MPTSKVRLSIGDITVIGLSDGEMPVHPQIVFPDLPESYWEQYRERFPESLIDLPGAGLHFNTNVGVFLIRTGAQALICDTGLGPNASMVGFPGKAELLKDMTSQGVDTGEVDTVFLTHLHADHVGWNLRLDHDIREPTFPKATYAFGKADWEHFTSAEMLAGEDGPTTKERVMPLVEAGRARLLEGEVLLAPGITAFPTPGHTPGHMSLLLASRSERALILGDLVGSPMQVTEAELPYGGDADRALGVLTRIEALDMAEKQRMVVMGPHLPKPGWGHVIRFQGRRYWQAL